MMPARLYIVVFGSSLPSTTKKKKKKMSKVDPLCQNFLDPRMICPDETCQMYEMTIQNTLIPSLWLAA